jgi:uncharacterized cupredoxin-like copper-binding protein
MAALRRRTWLVALACALALGACGGGGDAADEGAGEGQTEITADAHEFAFEPSSWTAAADTDVTITLTNSGETEHEWAVLNAGEQLESEEDFADELVAFEVEAIPPGEEENATFNLPGGTYQVICALPGHFAAGMEGTLTLE